jgi:type VI secretion system secreted protein VgrG
MTTHPVVRGAQTAVVVGPAGEEIYVDKYGRIKVQFHWDREGKDNEQSSCWVRVAQLWAGKNWGSIFIPRIGQEVIVDFLEGDPDQPIVTGRVYNAEQMPPYRLPGEATKSTIKSYSSKGGGGFNEIRFEDKKGDEQVFIHAEKNLDIRVKNDEYKTIEKDLHLVVEQNHFEHIKNGRNITIDKDLSEKIGSDHHKEVTGKEAVKVGGTLSLKVDGNVAESFGQGHSEQVSMAYSLKAMNIVLESDVGITLKCGSNSVVIDPVGVTLKGTMLVLDGVMTMINSGPGSPPTPGTPGVLVPPLAPKPASDADKADPGEMAVIKHEQIQQQKGKYGSVKLKPFNPDAAGPPDPAKKKTWIEIQLKDEMGKPVPGEAYRILLADGSAAEGSLDEQGFARVDGIDPGTAKITFPNLDQDTWEPA